MFVRDAKEEKYSLFSLVKKASVSLSWFIGYPSIAYKKYRNEDQQNSLMKMGT